MDAAANLYQREADDAAKFPARHAHVRPEVMFPGIEDMDSNSRAFPALFASVNGKKNTTQVVRVDLFAFTIASHGEFQTLVFAKQQESSLASVTGQGSVETAVRNFTRGKRV